MDNPFQKFFVLVQNDTGGRIITDEQHGIGRVLVFEASDATHAMERAEALGIEFDDEDENCADCCGVRWHRLANDAEGTEVPTLGQHRLVYDDGVFEYRTNHGDMFGPMPGNTYGFVHFLGGTVYGIEKVKDA